MELKLYFPARNAVEAPPFNRTIVELKLHRTFGSQSETELLIVP